jgi:hypothetical protein
MEPLINLANVLYIMSYFAKDPLRFRVLTIIAGSCLVIYFLLQPELSITIVYWNTFFVMLNAFQLVRILIERHLDVDPVSLAVAAIKKNLPKQKVSSQESYNAEAHKQL